MLLSPVSNLLKFLNKLRSVTTDLFLFEVRMITIKIGRLAGRVDFLSSKGHADYAEHGEDIVCAAVSAILQNLLQGAELLGISAEWYSAKPGKLYFKRPKELSDSSSEKLSFLLDTTIASLTEISKEYPKYLKLI